VANVGMFEASVVFGLTTSGIPLPVAVAIAATHHVLQLIAVVVLAGTLTLQQRWGKKVLRSETVGE
jgi:orotate phosphoribosyltransferase